MGQEEVILKVREAIESDPDREYFKSISLFGSFLHGTANYDSDIDLFFEQKKSMGYFKLYDIQQRLAKKIGREVDLVPKDSIDKYIRNEVITESKLIYEYR